MNIDKICQMTTNPEMLNALHACRDGHPLGAGNSRKWRNAFAMSGSNHDISSEGFLWLGHKAIEERTSDLPGQA